MTKLNTKTDSKVKQGVVEEPSDYLIEAIKEAEIDRDRGDVYSFDDSKDALKFIDDVINDKINV